MHWCREKMGVKRGDTSMSRDFERLEALRRITVKRGATKAEAATARRLANALQAKIGKRSRTRGREAEPIPLPEPSWARKRRIWGNRLDGALDWAGWLSMMAMPFLLVLFVLPTVVIVLDFLARYLTGHDPRDSGDP